MKFIYLSYFFLIFFLSLSLSHKRKNYSLLTTSLSNLLVDIDCGSSYVDTHVELEKVGSVFSILLPQGDLCSVMLRRIQLGNILYETSNTKLSEAYWDEGDKVLIKSNEDDLAELEIKVLKQVNLDYIGAGSRVEFQYTNLYSGQDISASLSEDSVLNFKPLDLPNFSLVSADQVSFSQQDGDHFYFEFECPTPVTGTISGPGDINCEGLAIEDLSIKVLDFFDERSFSKFDGLTGWVSINHDTDMACLNSGDDCARACQATSTSTDTCDDLNLKGGFEVELATSNKSSYISQKKLLLVLRGGFDTDSNGSHDNYAYRFFEFKWDE